MPSTPDDAPRKPRKAKAAPTSRRRGGRRAAKPQAAKPAPAKPVKAKPAKPAQPAAAKPAKPKAAKPKAAKPARPVQAKAAKPRAPKPQAARPGPGRGGAPVEDKLIGRVIARCRIEALIGLGRTARVYRAHYEALDQVVALKILRDEVAEHPLLVQRFHSEAKAIARVDNENVLKIYDVGTTDDGLHYMVVELLEGEEVMDLITREERIEAMDGMRIVRQAANGLAAAHGIGLVHRDIKPQNLFLLEDGTVKVVDFGLAASIDDDSERVGTPHYMAPEVCERGAAEPASDIYGLGIVLYHLLVGRPPYAGQDVKGILKSHMEGKPLRPERDAPGTPKDVCEIVRSLTKHDPLLRPTASEVVDQLDAVGGKEIKEKASLGRRRRRSSRARSAVARRDRAEARKSTPVMALVLGGVVVVGGIAALVSMGGDDTPETPPAKTADADRPGADTSGKAGTSAPVIAPKREETPEEKAAREKTKAAADAERDAKEALERAEAWAREHWKGPADTDAVLEKYAYVRRRYKDTKAGEEAKERVRLINRRKLHPHPDREYSSEGEIQTAKDTWESVKPQVLEKIAAMDYGAAVELLPPPIADDTGSFTRELTFWREYLGHLVAFRKATVEAITKAEDDDRIIDTPDGEGRIVRATPTTIDVRVNGKTTPYAWKALGAQPIADIALNLFTGDADRLLTLLAFAYAHELESFWDVQLDLNMSQGARDHSREVKEYEKRFRERAN